MYTKKIYQWSFLKIGITDKYNRTVHRANITKALTRTRPGGLWNLSVFFKNHGIVLIINCTPFRVITYTEFGSITPRLAAEVIIVCAAI